MHIRPKAAPAEIPVRQDETFPYICGDWHLEFVSRGTALVADVDQRLVQVRDVLFFPPRPVEDVGLHRQPSNQRHPCHKARTIPACIAHGVTKAQPDLQPFRHHRCCQKCEENHRT